MKLIEKRSKGDTKIEKIDTVKVLTKAALGNDIV